ncbi:peptidoglycan DD-metalloendopeptidase family protein [Clostridiaceae bacterium 35-E11]
MKQEQIPDKLKKYFSQYYRKISQYDKNKKYLGFIAGILAIAIFAFVYSYNAAYAVKVDGKVVGVVRDKKDFTMLIDEMQTNLHKAYNTEIVLNQTISYERTKAKKNQLTTEAKLKSALKQMMNFEVKAYGIKANDQLIAVLSTKAEADKVLEQLKNMYISKEETNANFEKIYFGEEVAVEEVAIETKNLKGTEEALKLILQGTEEIKEHEVQEGESFWTIAKKYKLTTEDLEKANPEVNPEKLQINQKISLIVPKPLLTVVTVEKAEYEEKIPFEIVFEDTSALFKGEKKIKVTGKDGKREVVAEIIKNNGIEVDKKILEETIIEEPQKQVVLQGTKNPPPKVGTGTLSNPTRGRLSSRFGYRWGRKHEGIDIAARIGTPVHAADGGKVVFAGTRSGYGKLVIVDHGANVKTYYAHNSKLVVSKGTKVFKGQKIAEVGNTGRSTGPHLHFEVRKNGVPVNPLKYVKY